MSRPLPIEQLREREYWTPGQCARVLGHGSQFWATALDQGDVQGYRLNGRGARHILVASARAFLVNGKKPRDGNSAAARRAIMAAFGQRIKAELG